VHREGEAEANLVYRRYSEFQELYGKLMQLFPMADIPRLPGRYVHPRVIFTVLYTSYLCCLDPMAKAAVFVMF